MLALYSVHTVCYTLSCNDSPGMEIASGLISEVSEEVATQVAKNCRHQPPHSHLRPRPTGTPASIRLVSDAVQNLGLF